MNQQRIVLAGATGNLGGRIARALRARGASVSAIVRPGTSAERLDRLRKQEVEIVEADLHSQADLVRACEGASCVVSALLGLRKTLIDAQGILLDAAVEAGVPRFIPSDYAMDFNKIAPGLNRNFDLHREFRQRCDRAPIRSTSILNGAFMHLLTGEAPLVLFKMHRVLYWGQNPDQLRGGSLGRLQRIIKITRSLTPDSEAPFPVWQGMQYLYCMFEGSGMLTPLDNQRYPDLRWTGVRAVLQQAV